MSSIPNQAERVLSVRKHGGGQQYEMKWHGQQEPTWEAASRMRRQFPLLVQAFEQQQQPPAEGATDSDEPMLMEAVVPAPAAQQPGAPQQSGMSLLQVQALEQLVREQAQQLRKQEQQHVAAMQQLLASSAHLPQLPVQPSPQLSPQQEPRIVAAAAAPAEHSRFAKKEPRAQDLAEYDGTSGSKLDSWLDELALARMLYELNAREALRFAVSRLRGAALQWWLALDGAAQAAIASSEALAAALRSRFQPVTAARTAREQLDKLAQGSRGVNEYIADFQRLRTLLPSMAEEDALYAFERGLRRELAVELRKQGVSSLQDAIALVARVGGLLQASGSGGAHPTRSAAINQMDIDDGDGASLDERISKAVLNAMQSQNNGGMGAKTQTQRGYQQEQRGGGRGGFRGGRGGRFGSRPLTTPVIPGVPAAVVEQRRAAGQCFRCGSDEHQGRQCPNATSATQRGN